MLTDLKIDRLKPEVKTKRYSDRDGLTLEGVLQIANLSIDFK